MLCPNCQTRNPAHAKFCLECGNRLIVCSNCQTINLPYAKFCIECGTSLQVQGGQTLQPLPNRSSTGVLEREPPGSEILLPSEERRIVTVMFADITGSTRLADRLDPEDMRAILTGYFNLMTEQIKKHGGTVEKYIGDAVMAVFGAPITHEDDPDRAIRAALDMQLALSAFNEQRLVQDSDATRLQMRIGINTGEVAIPNNANAGRQDFLITGDAVNVAARLQQVATPDTILVGERTYLVTREVFAFRPLAPLHLKGKAEPLSSYVALGLQQRIAIITQHPRGIEGRQAPLVGRTLELTLLHANYARVQAERHPHLITILGIPGIGKSRLVREFIAREQEKQKSISSAGERQTPRILQGRCPPYGEGITYWPLIEILRTILHVQDEENQDALQQRFIQFVGETLKTAHRTEGAKEIAEVLLRSIGRELSGKIFHSRRGWPKREYQTSTHSTNVQQSGTQVALLRAWRVLLEALAEQQPLIIVVDDLQWADEALLDLLKYLTDRITSYPILFLCPARPDFFERHRDWGAGQRNFTIIELESLSREECSELLDALLNSSELPEVLRNTILTRAEGNPFFVEEIVRMFIDQGVLVSEGNDEPGTAHWRLNYPHEITLHELPNSEETSEETVVNRQYVLPLPHVPDTIQGVLAARVDLLNATEKTILQHAAIIGRTFFFTALSILTSNLHPEITQQALEALLARDFIAETRQQIPGLTDQGNTYTFKHVLIRDVVYNNIPRTRRSREHAQLAHWLEETQKPRKEGIIELLAYHYQQALANWPSNLTVSMQEAVDEEGAVTPLVLSRAELRRKAITYLTSAGDQALQSYYTLRALQAYDDALELLLDDKAAPLALIQMHERLGDAYFQRASGDEAWQEYRLALRLATEEGKRVAGANLLDLYERLAELATRWFGLFTTAPDQQEIRTFIDAGLQLLQEKQELTRERVAFLTYLSFWYARQLMITSDGKRASFVEPALTNAQEALRLAEELKNPRLQSLTLDALSFIYMQKRSYDEAHHMQHRRLLLESKLTDRGELYDLYLSLGTAHEKIDEYATALSWWGRAWNYAQTMESPSMLLSCIVGRMHVWMQWNRWEDASQVAHEVLLFIEQYQQGERRQLQALETLAAISYYRGENTEGDRYARQFKRLLEQRSNEDDHSNKGIAGTMSFIRLASEDWLLARAEYEELLRQDEPLPIPEVVSTLAELLVITQTDKEEQEQMCERAVQLAEESRSRKWLAVALRAKGRMYTMQQEWKLAEENLRASLRLCELLDIPWEQANTLYFLGCLYRERSTSKQQQAADIGRARHQLELALGFFEALKAVPSIERVRTGLEQMTLYETID